MSVPIGYMVITSNINKHLVNNSLLLFAYVTLAS